MNSVSGGGGFRRECQDCGKRWPYDAHAERLKLEEQQRMADPNDQGGGWDRPFSLIYTGYAGKWRFSQMPDGPWVRLPQGPVWYDSKDEAIGDAARAGFQVNEDGTVTPMRQRNDPRWSSEH